MPNLTRPNKLPAIKQISIVSMIVFIFSWVCIAVEAGLRLMPDTIRARIRNEGPIYIKSNSLMGEDISLIKKVIYLLVKLWIRR